MNSRLKTILDNIDSHVGVIDVGTDHGYIPAALAKGGYEGNIFASDINIGPLESAKRTAEEEGVADKIEFFLSDGLNACDGDKVDSIVIAGMGGDLICRILDATAWVFTPKYQLILQPMTKAEILRFWLANNGFEIEKEILMEDGNIYQIIIAHFVDFAHNMKLTDAELYTGKLELVKDNPLLINQIDTLIKRFERAIHGMAKNEELSASHKYKLYDGIYNQLRAMRDTI